MGLLKIFVLFLEHKIQGQRLSQSNISKLPGGLDCCALKGVDSVVVYLLFAVAPTE